MNLMRQGCSTWMSALIIGHTKKILSINLDQGNKALLAVKGNALSTLPSMIWGILPRLKDESEAKKIIALFFFFYLSYTTAF